MASRTKLTDAATLELYRLALSNVENQPEIAEAMLALSYHSVLLGEGKALWDETRQAYDFKRSKDNGVTVAYADFSGKKAQLETVFRLHRKKAKVVFHNDSLIADQLLLGGCLPRTYVEWLEVVDRFYSVASSSSKIQAKLARLKIGEEDLIAAKQMIVDLKFTRAEYVREKGESQDATKLKDAAFAKLDAWISEFYAVAR